MLTVNELIMHHILNIHSTMPSEFITVIQYLLSREKTVIERILLLIMPFSIELRFFFL